MSSSTAFSAQSTATRSAVQSFVPRAGLTPLVSKARVPSQLKAQSNGRRGCVRAQAAQASTSEQTPLVKFAENIGLPVGEGLFGFTPFAEVWVGRLAMMGFITSIVEEAITGRGTLEQIGFATPSIPLGAAVVGIAAGLTLAATFNTVLRVTGGKMSPQQVDRYRNFLGLKKEDLASIKQQQNEMKSQWKEGQGDFTAPLNLQAIEETAREAKPVDGFLNMRDTEQIQQAAAELKAPSTSAQPQETSRPTAAVSEWDYARNVELNQGRLAMLGFLAAVGVEAFTGYGILGQLVMYGKWSGLLGPMSGF